MRAFIALRTFLAEPVRTQGCGATANKLPIKPSGTARVNLGVYWQVGALESSQLHDAAGRGVTGGVGPAHMVGAVHPRRRSRRTLFPEAHRRDRARSAAR
jgi:hypothetical protein